MEECKRSKITWKEVEIEGKELRKCTSISLLIEASKRYNKQVKERNRLYPIMVLKVNEEGGLAQTRQLLVDKCPLCGVTGIVLFSTKEGLPKIKKCLCGAKWATTSKRGVYTHKMEGGV